MRIAPLTGAAAAVLLLAACGSSPLEGKTGPEIVTAAIDALEAAGAVHIAGSIDQDGEEGEVDLHLQGDDATGTISLGGAELELLRVDGTVYLKGSSDFWGTSGMPDEVASMFEDQWVVMPDEAATEFDDFTLAGFVTELRDTDSPVKDDVRTDSVDGDDVVVVEQEDGDTMTVLDADNPYPLKATSEDSPDGVTFSRFGEEEEISAPDDALDLAEMMGGA